MNALQTYALCSALRARQQPVKITDDERWLERRNAAVAIKAQALDVPQRAPDPAKPPIYPPGMPSAPRRMLNDIHARHNAITAMMAKSAPPQNDT